MKFRVALISTTPRAKVPANRTPMAESSLTRRLMATTAISVDVTTPHTSAPRKMLCPKRKATTTPGKMAWERASPMKDRPRSTT